MQIRKKIKTLLFSFDQFGKPVNLLMKKQHLYHTVPGSIVSIGILFFTVFSFVSLTMEMLEGSTPNVVSTTTYTNDPEVFPIYKQQNKLFVFTPDNFRVQIIVSDVNGTLIKNSPTNSYYRVMVEVYEQTIETRNQTLTNVMNTNHSFMIPCSYTEKNQLYKTLKIDNGVDSVFYCIDDVWWKNNPLKMRGTAQTKIFNFFYITVLTCKNSTDPLDLDAPICAPQEEIEQVITQGFVGFSFVDQQLDQKKAVPFSPIPKLQYFRYDLQGDLKYIFYYLRHTIMNSVFNPFYYFGQSTVDHVLQYYRHEQTRDKKVMNGAFVGIQFFLDEQKIEYSRSYSNILTIFGSISGLFGALITVSSLILLPLCENLMNRTIIEGIFSFQGSTIEKEVQRNNSLVKKETIKQDLKMLSSRNISISGEPPIIQTKYSQIKNFFKQKDKGLNIQRFQDFVLSFFTGPKRQQILSGIEGYQSKLDVIFIIKKLIEIDKLKQLVLTQSQMKLFNYIPKPIIKLVQQSSKVQVLPDKSDFILDQKPFEIEVAEAIQAYEEISSSISELYIPDSINFKLIQMMDSDIKEAFQDAISQNKPSGTKVECPLNLQPSFKQPIEEFENILSNREF